MVVASPNTKYRMALAAQGSGCSCSKSACEKNYCDCFKVWDPTSWTILQNMALITSYYSIMRSPRIK